MLFYLCEKADVIRIAFGMLGMFLLIVLTYQLTNYEFTRVRTITAVGVATVLSFALFVLLPDSDLALELCRRAGITF